MATPLTLQELYDENFYRANYAELANLSSREIFQHFLTTGISEARRFSPFFNLNFYDTSNTDLASLNNRQLIDHFLNNGLAENRKFSQFIDLDFYRGSNPDLARLDNVDLFRHLKDFGVNEKRRFSPYLDIQFYRDNNPSLGGLSDRQLLDHFETTGVDQALTFSAFFDINFFRSYATANRASNPTLATLANPTLTNRNLFTQFQLNINNLPPGIQTHPFVDLQLYRNENPTIANLDNRRVFQHLQTNGLAEERTFSYYYDNSFYRNNNPDLRGLNNRQLWEHFLKNGSNEARSFSPFIDIDFYRSKNRDLANLSNRQILDQLRNSGLDEDRTNATISPFFDLNYYRTSNEALETLDNRELWQHLQTTGIDQGLRFSQFVDLDYYKSANPDLGGLNNTDLFEHLQTYGINEGRTFSPVVDLNVYRNSNPQLGGLNNRDLFEVFVSSGISGNGGGSSTTQFFDADFYRRSNPDLADAGIRTDTELLQHFQNFGLDDDNEGQGRKFSPYLDLDYYLRNNPDLAAANVDTRREAFDHFQRFGLDEGRRFSQFFDIRYYVDNNPDLRRLGMSNRQAFSHFQNFGIDEGRRPSLLFNPSYYIANNPDLAARRISFKEAFKDFQLTGFQRARPASIFFNPDDIAAVVSPNQGVTATDIPDWLQKAARWGDIPRNGTLTYSFVTTASAFLYEGTETNVSEIPDAVKNNVRNIMRQYDDVLGINLVEVPDRPPNVGRIRIMYSRGPADRNLIGYGRQPSDSPGEGTAGDIHLAPTFDFAPGPGNYSYEALLFVVGAALGLNDYNARRSGQQGQSAVNPLLTLSKDNNTNTTMTQNFVPGQYNGAMASTPMPYDVRALQYLYGASNLNNGDTTYSFNLGNFFGGTNERNETNGIKQTFWDAGGIDTLDFSAMPANAPAPILASLGNNVITPAPPRLDGYYLDMNEGGQLTTLYALNRATYLVANTSTNTQQGQTNPPTPYTTSRFNSNIAFGFEVENLVGSPGIDVILGNNLPNNISGGGGDDNITGAAGADRLNGGSGNDIFVVARGDGGPTVAAADAISDFVKGQDKIGLALGLPFGLLSISQGTGANARDTVIRIGNTGEYLALLTGVSANLINAGDFVSV